MKDRGFVWGDLDANMLDVSQEEINIAYHGRPIQFRIHMNTITYCVIRLLTAI